MKRCCHHFDHVHQGYIILFLAHDGIAQPTIWDAYQNVAKTMYNIDIFFEIIHQKRGQTQWGSISVVRDIIFGLKQLLIKYDREHYDWDTWRIFLVSGADIPIRSPLDLFFLPPTIPFFCFREQNPNVPHYTSHGTFFSMTLADVDKYFSIVDTPLHILKKWKQSLPYILSKKSDLTIFPELLFLNWYTHQKDKEHSHCTTLDFRRFPSSMNPITWDDFNTTKIVSLDNILKTKGERIRMSLDDVLDLIQRLTKKLPFLFFFRKISNKVNSEKLLEKLQNHLWNHSQIRDVPKKKLKPIHQFDDVTFQQFLQDEKQKQQSQARYQSRLKALQKFSQISDPQKQEIFLQSHYLRPQEQRKKLSQGP